MDLAAKLKEKADLHNTFGNKGYNCIPLRDALIIAREYAEECMKKLVDDLFINGLGETAHNLKMHDDRGRYIGGWSKFGAQSRIKKILEAQDGK